MSAPTPVVLVYPKLTQSTRWIKFVVDWAFLFLTSWIVMLLLPSSLGFDPGYWQTLSIVLVLRLAGLTNTGMSSFFAPTVGSIQR